MVKTGTYTAIGAIVIAGALGIAGWKVFVDNRTLSFDQCPGGQAGADIGGPFELVSQSGETVTDRDVITEPSLVYFGYTFCPDICPFDAVRNAEAVDILAERGYAVTPIMITVDPARDTPDVMGDFAGNVHEKMIGLSGSAGQVDVAAKAYRVYYEAHPEEDPEYYTVDHSTFTYLTFPDTGFAGFFRRDLSSEQVADRVQCFLDAKGRS